MVYYGNKEMNKEMITMKKYFIFALVLMLALVIAGCGGGSSPVNPSSNYILKITQTGDLGNSSLEASGVSSPAVPVEKDPSWYKMYTASDFITMTRIEDYGNWNSSAGTGCMLIIIDSETGEQIYPTPEEQETAVWTVESIPEGCFTLTTDLNGFFFGGYANGPGMLHCTVTYQGETAKAQTMIISRGTIDPANVSATYKTGFIFDSKIGTDNLDEADIWYTFENDTWYLNAPGGVSLILNSEPDPFEGGIYSWKTSGTVLRVPANLAYDIKVPCAKMGVYILKPRNGIGYVKFTNFVWPYNQLSNPIGFLFERFTEEACNLHY
jgi:hypothetical protein